MTLHHDQTWANSGLGKTKKWSGKNPDQNENKTRTDSWKNLPSKKSCLDFCQAKFLWSGPDRYLPTSDQESRFRTSLFEKKIM